MQILTVHKETKKSVTMTAEKAKRVAATNGDSYVFFEMRFAKTAVKPVLKPLTIEVVQKTRPEFTIKDVDGNEVDAG